MDLSLAQFLIYAVTALASAAFAGGGAYWAVKVKLEHLDRDVEQNKKDIRELRAETKADLGVLHSRVNRITERARVPNGQ